MEAPPISTPLLAFFRHIVRRYFRRHFHGVRLRGAELFVAAGADKTPLLVYANHASWWDPMVAIFLADKLLPSRAHYAPMDAEMLQRFGLLKRLGIFPVDMNTSRGAVQFLRTGNAVLTGDGVLWVTPQGRFVDARVRPLEFKPGLANLAARVATQTGRCNVIPLAIEYPFWNERLPECLLQFGPVVQLEAGEDASAVQTKLVVALETTMEELQARALLRDSTQFEELLTGSLGTGGFYGIWERVTRSGRRHHQATHRTLSAASATKVSEDHNA
jgi:1-acyl-sn-glycerol-3-phosphate acyltransferase